MSDASHRLPDDVHPERYDLVLTPDLDAATFTGEVTIEVTVHHPTDRIVLHALDLSVDTATVAGAPVELSTDTDQETVTLLAGTTLQPGSSTIHLTFTGVLNDQLVGFYRSTFRSESADGTSTEHTLAVTQFESTHARRAFPCFDEPALKAVFAITLVVPDDQFVVANTAELDRSPAGGGRVRVRFADTISMSTYLVAFVIGPLEATPPRMVAGIDGDIPLRVVYPPGNAELCEFALDVAEAGLKFYEDYYEIPYPGDKVDLVAVPDFAFGAMENLGCITFREVLLLIDPAHATQPELQSVADVINHELAHMWFGDLVTMDWWNGIWLNEAFATFMEVTATDAFRPDWDVWTTFGLARSAAFDTDALRSTRPIEYEVVTAADAEGMFDILTYEKGASVVRMLEQYLGAERFREGIATYLRRHAYGTTRTTDLWDALEEVTGEPVRRIMDSWIFRGGHPAVQVTRAGDGVALDQTRAAYAAEESDVDRWPIPMVLGIGDGSGSTSRRRLLLEAAETLDVGERPTFVQANVGGAGFYRVELDAELRAALLEHGAPGPLERFVLLDDTWAASLSGRVGLTDVVDLVRSAARDEVDPAVWRQLAAICRDVVRLAGPEHRVATAAFVAGVARPALDRLEAEIAASDGEPPARLLEARGVVFSLAGSEGDLADLRLRARTVLHDGQTDAALRAAAISVVAASASASEHGDLEQRWRAATTPQEELRYLNALVDTDDATLFDRALELATTEVRTQNAPYLLRRAIHQSVLGARAWSFVTERWDELTDRFPSNSLPRMLEGIRTLSDPSVADDVTRFIHNHPLPTGTQQVAQHLERMGVTVAAAQRVRDEIGRTPGMLGNAAS